MKQKHMPNICSFETRTATETLGCNNWAFSQRLFFNQVRRAVAVVVGFGVFGCYLSAAVNAQSQTDSQATTWNQILGPTRNGYVPANQAIPAKLELRIGWQVECGQGYAGPSIGRLEDDRKVVVVHERNGEQNSCQLLDLETGSRIWQRSWNATYAGSMDADRGPRCVPSIHGNRVVTYSSEAQLTCLSLERGEIVWQRDFESEMKPSLGYFGAGSTPLVIDGMVVLNLGSRDQAGILAVRLEDGANVWSATQTNACYSSPIVLSQTSASNGRLVLVPTRLQTFGLDLSTGKVLFETRFGSRGPSVVAAMPLELSTGEVFLTASYGEGSKLIRPRADGVDVLYEGSESIESQYATGVLINDLFFGCSGREDRRSGTFRCVDLRNDKVLWTTDEIGVASVITDGERLLVTELDGAIHLVRANPEKFELIESYALPSGLHRSLPAYDDGRVLIRRNDPQGSGRLYCLEFNES